VNFFYLDCLAGTVRLSVGLDMALTVLANGCYRWLARKLRGFAKATPKQLYRRFVETSSLVEVKEERIGSALTGAATTPSWGKRPRPTRGGVRHAWH
jgi:hypothetical protein